MGMANLRGCTNWLTAIIEVEGTYYVILPDGGPAELLTNGASGGLFHFGMQGSDTSHQLLGRPIRSQTGGPACRPPTGWGAGLGGT
jgi:hypothetical protein